MVSLGIAVLEDRVITCFSSDRRRHISTLKTGSLRVVALWFSVAFNILAESQEYMYRKIITDVQ